ncbi:UTRA domain-containing protein [Streptomyces sp. NPDC087525]|uniref:UTRA domain-containing protein n=1 Tax=Streptomyces sp. NPDC087525 TaxID=3365793 RepID=UPI0037FAACD3
MSSAKWTGSSTPYLDSSRGDAWRQEAEAQGHAGSQRITYAGTTAAPDDVSIALRLAPKTPVMLRRRLILLDGQPVELADSYWPVALAEGTALARPAKIPGGAVSLLAQLGYTAGSVDEQVRTRPPVSEEREALQMTDEDEWVLTLTRTITNSDGRPYEAAVMVSPGRIGRLNYSMKVG